MTFSCPQYLELSIVSELENAIIEICETCSDLTSFELAATPIWNWASQILAKSPEELRHEIETHETDEQFSDKYHEEKDHLLKLPLLILEKINSRL